ncbi:hypothetical protein ACFRLW_34580, partial [Streptomyces sp. NPDC056728]
THRGKFLNRLDAHLQARVALLLGSGKTKAQITASLKTELGNIGNAILKELKTGSPGPTATWTAP